MKQIVILAVVLNIILSSNSSQAGEISALQLLYLVKQAFPEKEQVEVFINKDEYKEKETNIKVASAQMKFKINVHLIEQATDIGQAFGKIADNSLLVIFTAEVFNKSSARLYVLSKCKDKQVAIITTSKEYSDSGALLCVYKDENAQLKVVLNLKKNEHLKDRFTEEVIQKAGIQEVVM